jgi:hypothetical protein
LDESASQVWFLNRGLVILRPKELFVQWVRHLASDDSTPVDELVQASTYLIPEFHTEDESWDWIRSNSNLLFELALNEWDADESGWPAERDWTALSEWFQVEFVDLVWDLVDEPLTSDPEDPEHQLN